MKLLIKHSYSVRLLIVLLPFVVMCSCKKADRVSEPLASDPESLSKAQRSSPKQKDESADFVHQWYKFMARIQLPNTAPAPPLNYRNFAYIGVGLFESVQPGINGGSSFSPKLYQMPAMPKPDMSKDYLWSASANAALASMFKLFLTGSAGLTNANRTSVDSLEAANYGRFQLLATADVLQRSQAFGRSIATAIYNWSTTDNFTLASDGWVPPVFPGAWVPTSTPPTIVGAYLGNSRPFLKYSLKALAPPIPIPYSTDPASQFYQAAREVHDLGGATTATPANAATARWWADAGGPGVGYPAPYHLISIATGLLESHNAGLWRTAEVYAKTGIGLKDGPIITFRSKFHYNLLRPITYIRQNNISSTWNSVLPSPGYPDYTSGLISNYGPAIQVLIREFGDVRVTDDIYSWRLLANRSYDHLSVLLKEAADSRIYAGIHYRFTQDISVTMGKDLGNEIAKIRVVGPGY
ncbi:MAG: vanadium-dependent haloperoxidase [Ferruginibacter sp.]